MSLTLPSMPPAAEHPLFRRLAQSGICPEIAADAFDSFVAQPGNTLVFFAEEPVKYREVLVTESRVSQIHTKAILRLRVRISNLKSR